MLKLKKSAAFHKRLMMFTRGYRERAGEQIALSFVDAVDNAIQFIQENPKACSMDIGASEHEILKEYAIKSWKVKNFAHSIFFRIDGNYVILETIHAHRMEQEQFYSDITDDL